MYYYIAMNRFKIIPGKEDAFETVWRERESHLDTLPGFVSFHLLRGPKRDDHTLYASHTVWETEEHFIGWTKSEAFRAAHKNAGKGEKLYLGHPEFEGFAAIQETLSTEMKKQA
ncbi:MAG: antibiotic biosynthesis monooxygenase [Pseudomonadota bacterium]